ncbi:Acyl-CoA-binding protein [Hondaea fermentalgiana]|uniref:Acyl-CoA-binding protein n=1 Tax=Hondaea fermentalgiana TaxID=2315210 RepID=A0A2R5GHS5_9STRA|nr:Acyl-CoA-binding protein [Hondaea fermentalgiana]|eukprot:GBG30447.1 Acyl-CoA-binding protein [Hondaea fermentalgiana]
MRNADEEGRAMAVHAAQQSDSDRNRRGEGDKMSDDLDTKFNQAVERVKTEKPKEGVELTNEDKLKVYALYKQATVGDVQGSQPWAVNFEARAKWDAWNAVKGKDSETAKKEYVEEVNRQLGEP